MLRLRLAHRLHQSVNKFNPLITPKYKPQLLKYKLFSQAGVGLGVGRLLVYDIPYTIKYTS